MDQQDHIHHIYALNDGSEVVLSERGGRIIKLVLAGVTVIQAREPLQELSTGSYLMCPWVNRLSGEQSPLTPVFRDGKGLPLHGLVVNADSTLEVIEEKPGEMLSIRSVPKLIPEGMPSFEVIYTLRANSFSTFLQLHEVGFLPACFGFHPFLQINDSSIRDLAIESNLVSSLKLNENLLPVYPFLQQDLQIRPHLKYDHLFHQEAGFLKLRSSSLGKEVCITSVDMHYWQVYTPPDGARIAVEPMTFCGDLYRIYSEQEFGKLPTCGEFSITVSSID